MRLTIALGLSLAGLALWAGQLLNPERRHQWWNWIGHSNDRSHRMRPHWWSDYCQRNAEAELDSKNTQTGTSYTVLLTDCAKLLQFTNSSAVSVTLPQGTGSFAAPFAFAVQVSGAGTVTITPTTSTINNGASTLVLTSGQGATIYTDGSGNYQVLLGGTSGVTSVSGNNGLTGTVTSTGNIGLAAIASPGALCNNTGSSAVPTTANCGVTGIGGAVVFATQPTMTQPNITEIRDGNGGTNIKSSATASAVDGLLVTNAATANPATVTLSPQGTDSNVNLSLGGKGTGVAQLQNGATATTQSTGDSSTKLATDAFVSNSIPSASGCSASGTTTLTFTLSGPGPIFQCSATLTASAGTTIISGTVPTNATINFIFTNGSGPYTVAAPSGFNVWAQPVQVNSIVSAASYQTTNGGSAWNAVNGSTAGYSQCPTSSAPGTSPSGYLFGWCDSTDLDQEFKNSAGSVFAGFLKGVDANPITGQVTSTHLGSALPINQGGTGTTVETVLNSV